MVGAFLYHSTFLVAVIIITKFVDTDRDDLQLPVLTVTRLEEGIMRRDDVHVDSGSGSDKENADGKEDGVFISFSVANFSLSDVTFDNINDDK